MIDRIARLVGDLSRSEARVAEAVLAAPENVVAGTLRDLALTAGVSEPTALRFCRTAGHRTFRAFQIALAQDVASRADADGPALAVTEDDTVSRSAEKVFDTTIAALRELRSDFSARDVERAAQALLRARRIDIYGLGASALVAADAQHKLFRITSVASAFRDSHMQLMAAATLGPDDCVLAISHSGATRELLETVEIARESGATIVAITRPGSRLAELAHIVIGVSHEEMTAQYTPMTSRIVHLVVLDALTVALALLSQPSGQARLDRMTRAISRRRLVRPTSAEQTG